MKNKMELNREAEVSFHGQCADQEFTLNLRKDKWTLTIQGFKHPVRDQWETIVKEVTQEQAGAILALNAAGEFSNDEINKGLYAVIDDLFDNVPMRCRLIP